MLSKARNSRAVYMALVALLVVAPPAAGAFMEFHGEITGDVGTGFGNVLTILVLHPQGVATTESGSIYWDGVADVASGDCRKPPSRTQTVQALKDKGFNKENLIIIFNLNQTGVNDALDLEKFSVRFYTSADGSTSFDAPFNRTDAWNTASTLGLTPQGQGTGTAGYVFRVVFQGAEGDDFFASNDNRVGMAVPDTDPIHDTASDGPDNFYIGDSDMNETIPEPSALVVVVVGGLAALARRRRR